MNKEDILGQLAIEPFQPFRIHLSDGKQFDIGHPDQVLVTDRKIIIGIDYKGPHSYESEVQCSLASITRIEPVGPTIFEQIEKHRKKHNME